jgi:hypothetical protein
MSPQRYRDFLLNAVVRDFLSWSRDRQPSRVTRLGETTIAPEALQAYRVRLSALAGRPTGELEVSSEPGEGAIAIDGDRKGRTFSTFVVSEGGHSVEVTPPGKPTCRETVNVPAGETKKVHCL